MKLLSLSGQNIGLLKGSFEFEFDEALTVITGPIGCGKSTILTMVRASLTNAFPGSASSWASWGTPAQEPCYFVASWRIGDKVLHIAKCVSGDRKFAALNIPRLRIEHADGKVEDVYASKEALERTPSLIPVPASIIDGHLIVDQDSITAPVASTPAKFKEIIHTLTRTSELEDMRGQVRDLLMSVTVPDVQGPLQEAQAEVNLLKGDQGRIEAEISTLMQQYTALNVDEVLARLDVLDRLKVNDENRALCLSRRASLVSSEALLQAQLKAQQEALALLRTQREQDRLQAEQARKDLYSADALLASNRRKEQLQERAASISRELQQSMALEPRRPAQDKPDDGNGWLEDALAQARQDHHLSLKRLSLVDQGKCPECGTSTEMCQHDRDQLKETLRQAADRVTLLLRQQEDDRRLRQEWASYESSSASYASSVASLMEKAGDVSRELQELDGLPPMTAQIRQELAKVASAFDLLERNIASAENSASSLRGHMQSQRDMLERVDAELASIPPATYNPHEYARLQKTNDDARVIKEKVGRLDGSLDSVIKSLDRAVQRLQAQEKRAASVKPTERMRAVLERVKIGRAHV